MVTSRIFLAIAYCALVVCIAVLAYGFGFRKAKAVSIWASILLLAAAIALDRSFPMPQQSAPSHDAQNHDHDTQRQPQPENTKPSDKPAEVAKAKPKIARGPIDKPKAKITRPADVVSLDVMFDPVTQAFNLTNRGTDNLGLWGDRLGDSPKSIEKQPTVITGNGGQYHILGQGMDCEDQRAPGRRNYHTIRAIPLHYR